jgi:cell wall-associated NlpC family hydrolase
VAAGAAATVPDFLRLRRPTRTPFVAVALIALAAFAASEILGASARPVRTGSALKPPVRARIATVTPPRERGVGVSVAPVAHVASAAQPLRRAPIAVAHIAMIVPARRAQTLPFGRIESLRRLSAARRAGIVRLSATQTQTVPGTRARIMPDGYAAAPRAAPAAVQEAIWAANRLIGMPYVYGGGHGSFYASGYDCSGTVSFALHGGDLLSAPMDSSEFYAFGYPGAGRWITVYTNPGHAFLEIAGIRLDTSSAGQVDGAPGPRWRPLLADTSGYEARHPGGY